MPWIQDHLLSVIELIPITIEPGDDFPNFHGLRLRISLIERQHAVLSVQAWIEDNEDWLRKQGLQLLSGRSGSLNGDRALTFYETFEGDTAPTREGKPERNSQVDRLVDLLDLHSSESNQTFIELLVEDLNHIRWDPTRAPEVLAIKVSETVSDPFDWLRRHSADRQARALDSSTATVTLPLRGQRL